MRFPFTRRRFITGAAALLLPARIHARTPHEGAPPMQEKHDMLHSHEIMWRRVMDDSSFELATIEQRWDGFHLSGTVLVAEQGAPLRLEYRLVCDAAWRTRSVQLSQCHLGYRRTLRLDHDGEGRWSLDGAEAPALSGCSDVDLGLSPSTNALPINRLRLAQGATATIRAAWVRFPALDVVAAEQSYQRLDARRYRYRSLASGFQAELEVDEDGLPIDYAGVWHRVAQGPSADAAAVGDIERGFVGALVSHRASDELAETADDFGWLVGGWSAQVQDFEPDGTVLRASGEWWFAWVLDGRAMQDVWISPARADRRRAQPAGVGGRYGTTIRHFDQASGLWRITWINPVGGAMNQLAGKRERDRIELLGDDAGTPIRWTFHDITPQRFSWSGERRQANGRWRREAAFELERMA